MTNRRFHLAYGFQGIVTIVAVAIGLTNGQLIFGQGATQAVRGAAGGLSARASGGISVAPPAEAPPAAPPSTPSEAPPPSAPSPGGPMPSMAGKIDTTFVSPTAAVLIVVRPGQVFSSPLGQLLPTEVLRQSLGSDPAEIDEIVAFGDFANPMAPAYGVTFKFKQPFRAVNIPANWRPAVKLGDLNGKKYLQSEIPNLPSFYGASNKILVVAPDAVLQQVVSTSSQPRSGGLVDRVREVPAGSDFFAAVNVDALRGLLPFMLAASKKTLTPDEKAMLDAVSALEITANVATHGPLAVVLHCTDEAGAQKVEAALTAMRQNVAPPPASEQPPGPPELVGPPDATAQAMTQYWSRIAQRYPVQRNGNDVTYLKIEADDPLQPQLFGMALGMAAGAAQAIKAMPQIEAMKGMMGPPGGAPPGMPPGGPEVPGGPMPPAGAAPPAGAGPPAAALGPAPAGRRAALESN